jgi:hypothetical protein
VNEPVVRLVLHYAGGGEADFVLRQGVHFQIWRYSTSWPPTSDPATTLVWQAVPVTELRSPFVTALWHTPLANPRPDELVEAIELRTLFGEPSYTLAAATLEQGPPVAGVVADASRHPPLEAAREPVRQLVRLVDEQDESPLNTAVVSAWVRLDGMSLYWGKHPIDASGQAVLYLPRRPIDSIDLIAVGLDHVPTRFSIASPAFVDPSREVPEAVIPMRRGETIGGRVVDGEGNPIAGAAVTIGDVIQIPGGGFAGYDWPTVVSDADGAWSIGAAPEEFERLTLHVTHPEHLPADYEQDSKPRPYVVTGASLSSGEARLELSAGVALTGSVESSTGVPVPNAKITLFDGPTPRADRRHTVTDADGQFRIGRLFTGEVRLLVEADGYRPELLPLRIAPGMGPCAVSLERAQTLQLQAGAPEGEPLPGVQVMLALWMGERWLEWIGETDGDGRIDWVGAPSTADYLVLHPDHIPQVVRLQSEDGIVHLPLAGGGITGRVLDEETGEPVAVFSVVPGQSFSPGQTYWERHQTQSGRDGRFTLRDSDTGMMGVQGMQRRVLIEARGYLPSMSDPFAGPTNLVVRLKRGSGPQGVVVGPDGGRVAGAQVTMAAGMEYAYMDEPPRFRQTGAPSVLVMTGPDGAFELPPRIEVRGIYAAHEQGIGWIGPEELAATSKIVLQPWGRIEGVLKVGDRVTEEQSISLHRPQRHRSEGNPATWLSIFVKAQPESDGRFEFAKVPPFEVEVTLEWPPSPGQAMPWSHPVLLEIEPGATHPMVIGGTGRAVVGRVRIEGEVEGELNFLRDVQLLTRIPSIPPPAFQRPAGGSSREEMQAAITEYQKRQIAFWQSEEGRQTARESGNYVLRFNSDGTFRCDHVPPGSYTLTLRFTREGSQPWESHPLADHTRQIIVTEGGDPLDLGEIVVPASSNR